MPRRFLHAVLYRLGYVQDSGRYGEKLLDHSHLAQPMNYDLHAKPPDRGMKLILTHVEQVHLTCSEQMKERRPVIRNSRCANEVFRPFFEYHLTTYEAMRVILLDAGRRVRGVLTIGQGGLSETTADHRLLFAAALKTLSTGIILAHNHPSGRLTPSVRDLEWTRKVKSIGELHDIPLEDHLILTEDGYLSMADEGML